MLGNFNRIYELLSQKQRLQAGALLILTTSVAFFELIGVASILPFMAVLSSPETITTNRIISEVYETLGFRSHQSFLIFLGIVTFTLLMLGNAAKAVNSWASNRFSGRWGHTISLRLFEQYLGQPYIFFIERNSSELRKLVLGEVQVLISGYLIPLLDVISRALICIAVVGLIFLADPILAGATVIVLGGAYVLVYATIRKWLSHIGALRSNAQTARHKIVNEALQGIKNVKLTGQEAFYVKLFEKPSRQQIRANALAVMAAELPRYALESFAFGGLLFVVLFKLSQTSDLQDTLPIVTLYAVAGYRLMPNFQAIFASATKIRFNSVVMTRIHEELQATQNAYPVASSSQKTAPLTFEREIRLERACFSYSGALRPVFGGLDLSIRANTIVGIVGKSGAGKTTLVDVLIGLLQPSDGDLFIDDTKIGPDNIRAWQANVAYVSQHIYLSDDSLRRNIAFGASDSEIDEHRIEEVLRITALKDLVDNDLPRGLDTVLGENGVRLSGGQRQRVGIARALYLDRPVLVLDEATSALDMETEREVMAALNGLGRSKTVIMIAHRLESLSAADAIIDLSKFT